MVAPIRSKLPIAGQDLTLQEDLSSESPGSPALLDALTDGQRECLRLVHQHKTSKEIAILLGISKYTVDQRIERACHKLRVDGRGRAAVLLAEHDRSPATDRIVYEPVDLEAPPPPASTIELQAAVRSEAEPQVAQGQAGYNPYPGNTGSLWQAAVPKGNANDLTPAARIKWIVQLMVQIVIAILLLLVLAQALSGLTGRAWPSPVFNYN